MEDLAKFSDRTEKKNSGQKSDDGTASVSEQIEYAPQREFLNHKRDQICDSN